MLSLASSLLIEQALASPVPRIPLLADSFSRGKTISLDSIKEIIFNQIKKDMQQMSGGEDSFKLVANRENLFLMEVPPSVRDRPTTEIRNDNFGNLLINETSNEKIQRLIKSQLPDFVVFEFMEGDGVGISYYPIPTFFIKTVSNSYLKEFFPEDKIEESKERFYKGMSEIQKYYKGYDDEKKGINFFLQLSIEAIENKLSPECLFALDVLNEISMTYGKPLKGSQRVLDFVKKEGLKVPSFTNFAFSEIVGALSGDLTIAAMNTVIKVCTASNFHVFRNSSGARSDSQLFFTKEEVAKASEEFVKNRKIPGYKVCNGNVRTKVGELFRKKESSRKILRLNFGLFNTHSPADGGLVNGLMYHCLVRVLEKKKEGSDLNLKLDNLIIIPSNHSHLKVESLLEEFEPKEAAFIICNYFALNSSIEVLYSLINEAFDGKTIQY